MGGAKKKNLAQMEKQQIQQDKKPEPATKKGKSKTASEAKKTAGIILPNFDEKFMGELSKMGALTPYSISNQFNVRLSVARDILEELERRRLIKSEGGNARIKIYRLAAA